MSRPIEQALNNLIPRHPGSLPPELIELASSLLAQSRSKISNLRADEEIGRTYVCANIACERLKTTLNLPTIEARPPCPPKVYKKLYGHFDQILTVSSSRRRSNHSNPPTPSKQLPQKRTLAKENSLEGFRINRTPKRGLRYGSSKKEKLPRWVGPAIRKICAEFDAGKAVPHVWAGVESVLFLPCPRDAEGGKVVDQNERMKRKIPALVAAVFFYVVAALENKQTNPKKLSEERKRILKILSCFREDDAVIAKVGEGEEGWEGWEAVSMKDLNNWIFDINQKGWLEMEWRTNIVDGSGMNAGMRENDDGELDGKEEDKEEMERSSKRVRRIGLGTMMQAKFDYLSDEKRDQYAAWKEAMLKKINDLAVEHTVDDDMVPAEG